MKIIAHRGFSGKFPENTRAAFEAALAVCNSVETDIRYNSINGLYLAHDLPANPQDAEALDLTWPLLQRFEWINIEIKEAGAIEPFLQFYRKQPKELQRKIVMSCFDLRCLRRCQEQEPTLQKALLFHGWPLNLAEAAWALNIVSVHANYAHVDKEAFEECRKAGWPLYLYTVNGALPQYADGVFTDFPDRYSQKF